MYHRYGWNGIQVTRDDLTAFAWSAPMRELAANVGLSDVGLRKLLVSHGVTLPPQGHWNRVHAGRSVSQPPKAPPRRPGETGRAHVDARLAPFMTKAKSLPAIGPFATTAVPEDLEELRAQELKAIGKVSVSRMLDVVHPGLRPIVEKEKLRRQKDIDKRWNSDSPRFDNPLDQRKLRLLNGIFLTLAKRGHSGEVYENDGELHHRVFIGDTSFGLTFEIAGKHRTAMIYGRKRPAPDLPANTPLILQVRPSFDREIGEVWQDDAGGKLEAKLSAIVAGLIVTGETKFRRNLQLAEEQAERERIEREAKAESDRIAREERRIAKLKELNEQRVRDLQRSGELLRLAGDIRVLIVQVREAMAGRTDVDGATIDAWQSWAQEEADKLDPVLSGQIFAHLKPPEI